MTSAPAAAAVESQLADTVYAKDIRTGQWGMYEFDQILDYGCVPEPAAGVDGDPASAPGAGGVSAPAPGPEAGADLRLDILSCFSSLDVQQVEAWLLSKVKPGAKWRQVLNNHTTNRAKATETAGGTSVGGPIIPSIQACHVLTDNGGGRWTVDFDFPNSFAPGDGVRLQHTYANTTPLPTTTAVANGCREVFVHLLMRSPFEVSMIIAPARPRPDTGGLGNTAQARREGSSASVPPSPPPLHRPARRARGCRRLRGSPACDTPRARVPQPAPPGSTPNTVSVANILVQPVSCRIAPSLLAMAVRGEEDNFEEE